MPTRTPRKDKVWTIRNYTEDGGWNFAKTGDDDSELLADLYTDLGISRSAKLTVMRIIGQLWLGALGVPSSAAYDAVSFGVTWMSFPETQSSAAHPTPLRDGMRVSNWIHQFQMGGKELESATEIGMPLNDNSSGNSSYTFDSTQMRQQKNPGDTLRLIAGTEIGTWESATVGLFGWVGVMLALP